MRAKLAIAVAVLLGLVAAVGVRNYLQREQDKLRKDRQPVRILVAAKRIPKGAIITREMISTREVSKYAVTELHMLERDLLLALGMRSNRDIERNSDLTRDYFEQAKLNMDQDEQALPKGYRAVTVSVDAVTGVAGNVRPGSCVDVFGTFEVSPDRSSSGARPQGAVTRTVLMLANVLVLAVDNRTTATQYVLAARRQGAVYTSVTLAVTPEEAMQIVYGQTRGKITLALRNALDVLPGPALVDVDDTNFFRRVVEARDQRRKFAEEKANPAR